MVILVCLHLAAAALAGGDDEAAGAPAEPAPASGIKGPIDKFGR
jgi:hypothetical protein